MVTEDVWDDRFRYVSQLSRMGANIHVDGKIAVVQGVEQLRAAPVKACDLRAGAAMVIAGLCAEGSTRIEDIHYIETKERAVVVHTLRDCITLNLRFSGILNQLPSDFFVNSHKGIAINMMHIVSMIGSQIVLSNGVKLPVSRRSMAEVRQALTQFLQTYRD